jgi:3-oxoacyl-[acyl-carrier-protein] synthase III
MRLTGIDCQIPSNKVTNEDIIEMVRYYSMPCFNGAVSKLETLVRRFLKLTGVKTRFWRAQNERPTDMAIIAFQRALKMANLNKGEINLLIYSGIDRGFIEPANASFFCKLFGINCRNFDIVDGCMGWSSAVQTAYSFLNSDEAINNIMIVNAEFPMDKKGTVLPGNFSIREIKELDWKSPSFTLGEAISVCIFSRNEDEKNLFEFIEAPNNAQYCYIPVINFEKYVDEDLPVQEDMQFYSDGSALLENGMQSSIDVLKKMLERIDYTPKFIFPHSVSERIIQEALNRSETNFTAYSTFSELGNLATVSIPSAITKACLKKEIEKGDRCIAWVASAGMKFSAIEICL